MGTKQIIESFEAVANMANDASYSLLNLGEAYKELTYYDVPTRHGSRQTKHPKHCRPLTEKTKQADLQGRNELCACGSGLKFKKCCLNK